MSITPKHHAVVQIKFGEDKIFISSDVLDLSGTSTEFYLPGADRVELGGFLVQFLGLVPAKQVIDEIETYYPGFVR